MFDLFVFFVLRFVAPVDVFPVSAPGWIRARQKPKNSDSGSPRGFASRRLSGYVGPGVDVTYLGFLLDRGFMPDVPCSGLLDVVNIVMRGGVPGPQAQV